MFPSGLTLCRLQVGGVVVLRRSDAGTEFPAVSTSDLFPEVSRSLSVTREFSPCSVSWWIIKPWDKDLSSSLHVSAAVSALTAVNQRESMTYWQQTSDVSSRKSVSVYWRRQDAVNHTSGKKHVDDATDTLTYSEGTNSSFCMLYNFLLVLVLLCVLVCSCVFLCVLVCFCSGVYSLRFLCLGLIHMFFAVTSLMELIGHDQLLSEPELSETRVWF